MSQEKEFNLPKSRKDKMVFIMLKGSDNAQLTKQTLLLTTYTTNKHHFPYVKISINNELAMSLFVCYM